MGKLSENLVTGNLAPWQTELYQFLNLQERETLKKAYEQINQQFQEALMAKQSAIKQAELDNEITTVNCSLESPKLVFTIADLKKDPSIFESEMIDFLRRHTGDDVSLIGSSRFDQNYGRGALSQPDSKMNFAAKIKWSLVTMEVIPANGKFTVIVTVPIE